MTVEEMREQTVEQLREELLTLKKEQFNLRFQAAASQLDNTSRVRIVRRDVARVLTVMNEKARDAAASAA
jgi:large subunit ribosomal protein L29